MEHRGFVAWVCSDGVPLAAHAVAANERTIRAWIATEPGKVRVRRTRRTRAPRTRAQAFSVHWKDLHGGARVRGTVHVDGVRCCGAVSKGFRGEVVDRSSCMAGATTSRPLLFVAMPVTGACAQPRTKSDYFHARRRGRGARRGRDGVHPREAVQGRARRRERRARVRRRRAPARAAARARAREEDGPAVRQVPHRSLARAFRRSHGWPSLGPEQLEVPHRIVETRPLDPTDPGPHVVFEFYYRSHGSCGAAGVCVLTRAAAWLEAQGIVQPPKRERQEDTPEPKPSRKKSRILVDKNASEDVKSSQVRVFPRRLSTPTLNARGTREERGSAHPEGRQGQNRGGAGPALHSR